MKLRFKQRFFSWFDSYDVYYESGDVAYTVKGQLSWGHLLKIYDAQGEHLGTVEEQILTFLPKFDLYVGEEHFSTLCKEFTFFTPKYEFRGGPEWQIEGDFMGWEYTLADRNGLPVAEISKELFNWTDTYVIDVFDSANALTALMAVIAIDAEKCSNS